LGFCFFFKIFAFLFGTLQMVFVHLWKQKAIVPQFKTAIMQNIYSNRFVKDSDARRPASPNKCFNFWDSNVNPMTMMKNEPRWDVSDDDQRTNYDYQY